MQLQPPGPGPGLLNFTAPDPSFLGCHAPHLLVEFSCSDCQFSTDLSGFTIGEWQVIRFVQR